VLRQKAPFLSVVSILLILQGCGGSSTSPPSGGQTLNIYYAIPLTGGFADAGQTACNGAIMAADEINASGGIPSGPEKGDKFAVQCIDSQQSPEVASTIASRYAADPSVWTMMGFYSSGEAQAAGLVAQRSNLSIIGSNVGGSFLTEGSLHNVLVMIPPLQSMGYAWVDFCHTYYGASKIADLSPNFSYTPDYRKGRDKALGAISGVSLVSEQTYDDSATKDWSPYLSKIKDSGAQCLLLGSYPPEQCTIAAQARQIGLNIAIVDFTDSGTSQSCVQAAGSAYVGLAFGQYIAYPPTPGSKYADAFNKFQAKYNNPMGSYPAYSYDSVVAVECALMDGAKTREDLVTYLPKINCTGITGQLQFTNNKPSARTLTRTEASSNSASALDPVVIYTGFPDGTAKLVKVVATCASRPTCSKFAVS
jgi:branched-chain amino acid transport system substrate-binding protein